MLALLAPIGTILRILGYKIVNQTLSLRLYHILSTGKGLINQLVTCKTEMATFADSVTKSPHVSYRFLLTL